MQLKNSNKWTGNVLNCIKICLLYTTVNASNVFAADFGINSSGTLYHTDGGWTASFNFLCINDNCQTATRQNGLFTRDVSSLSSEGEQVTIRFNVQDNSFPGGQCTTESVVTVTADGVEADSSCTRSDSGPAPDPDPAPQPDPDPSPQDPDPTPQPGATEFDQMAIVEGSNGNVVYIFELPEGINAIYHATTINGADQGFSQITNDVRVVRAASDNNPNAIYRWESPYTFSSGEFCYRIQANGNGETYLPGPAVNNTRCFNRFLQSEPPTGTLAAIPAGPWSETITLSGTATGDFGSPFIDVLIGGDVVNTTTARSDGTFTIDLVTNQGTGSQGNVTPNYPNGNYTIEVVARGLLGGEAQLGNFTRAFSNREFLPDVLVTDFAVRLRLRHEGEQRTPQSHDRFDPNYASGTGYYYGQIIDYEDHVEIKTWSFAGRPSVGNCVIGVRPNSFAEVPQYTVGCPAISNPSDGATHEMHIYDVNGVPWSEFRQRKTLLTWEYTTSPYYSSIMRYRSGQGGFGWKYEDPAYHAEAPDLRYYTGGLTSSNPVSGDGLEFSQEFNGINGEQMGEFLAGRVDFRQDFVDDEPATGGPLYTADSCLSCHINGTRGQSPLGDGTGAVGLSIRVGANGDPALPHPEYGGVLDTRSVEGVPPEGRLSVSGTSPGPVAGTTRLNYQLQNLAYGSVQNFEVRMAPQLPGLGLLEAIDNRTLEGFARAGSGRVHRTANGAIGRFGWKASVPTIREQVAKAYRNDMGVTNSLFPTHNLTEANTEAQAMVGSGIEFADDDLDVVTAYIVGLGIPVRRHPDVKYGLFGTGGGRLNPEPVTLNDPEIMRGERLFADIGCASCHMPEVRTGNTHPWVQLRNQVIRPYTDLLLHDMGEDLAGLPEGDASATEWRTPPLWGTRLLDRLAANSNFADAQLPFTSDLRDQATWLHDGRAQSREEAILWHGGEGEASRNAFMNLSASDRTAVLQFLQSL